MRAVLALPALVSGHGNMLWPPAWWDAGAKIGLTPGNSCGQGCGGKNSPSPIGCRTKEKCQKVCQAMCMWFTDNTAIPKGAEPTIARDSPLRTFYDLVTPCTTTPCSGTGVDRSANHPWRYPGSAPIYGGGCGVAGGNPNGCPKNTDPIPIGPCPEGATQYGADARYYDFPDVVETTWKAGQAVEVSWLMNANHGGGYAYRLCPADRNATGHLQADEQCFQDGHLDFVGDTQWFQFGYNRSTRGKFGDIKAVRVAGDLTLPKGSMWTRNPIPPCHGPGTVSPNGRGGGNQTWYPNKGGTYTCSKESYSGSPQKHPESGVPGNPDFYGLYAGPQFDPVGGYPGKYADQGIYTYGFGNNQNTPGGIFMFSIIDLIQVPKDIKPGKYVLSHRYDTEETSQVWNTCSTINILPTDSKEPDQALIPDGPTGLHPEPNW